MGPALQMKGGEGTASLSGILANVYQILLCSRSQAEPTTHTHHHTLASNNPWGSCAHIPVLCTRS